jgi:hypothetical protein
MKRIKLVLICIAIMLALGTAFATRPCQSCIYSDQYYFNGYTYVYAGEFGYDYYCLQFGGTCTYYRPYPFTQPNYFLPCRTGVYTVIP